MKKEGGEWAAVVFFEQEEAPEGMELEEKKTVSEVESDAVSKS